MWQQFSMFARACCRPEMGAHHDGCSCWVMPMLGFMCCCSQVFKATGGKVDYKVGTMIEVPRGALIAGQLAKTAEFFSFGTNDLTQMTFGISRDDAQVGLVHSQAVVHSIQQ